MPSGHKAFLVNNVREVDLLLMHNRLYAAEYVNNTFFDRIEYQRLTELQDRTRSLRT
jgi:hypothetical protein